MSNDRRDHVIKEMKNSCSHVVTKWLEVQTNLFKECEYLKNEKIDAELH